MNSKKLTADELLEKDSEVISGEVLEIKKELGKFPFSVLWEDEMETSIFKFVPIVNAVLLIIVIIMIAWK